MFELVHETKFHPLEILLMVSTCNLEIQKLTAKLKSLILMKNFRGKCLLPLIQPTTVPHVSLPLWTHPGHRWALFTEYIPVTSHGALDMADYTSSSQLPFKTQISAIFLNVQTHGFCLMTLDTAYQRLTYTHQYTGCHVWSTQLLPVL